MKIFETIREMREFVEGAREKRLRIAFVPTMGYFHEGHLNLMREGKKYGDILVISIYVNPTQFSPSEDLSAYPRNLARDHELAAGVGVDVIFQPNDSQMYPEGSQTYVNVEKLTRNLCGVSRPHHFRGVTTVCAKLFNIVEPHTALFGKKDYQQLAAIKRMVADLGMNIEVIGMPTTREPGGLAMSSRNVYLSKEERQSALSLSHSLHLAQSAFKAGQCNAAEIIALVREHIGKHPYTDIDYVQICETMNFTDVETIEEGCLLALAVRVGKARLIDNHIFGEEINIPSTEV